MTLSTSIGAVRSALTDSGKAVLAMESVSICRCRESERAVGVDVGVNVDGLDCVVRSWARGVRGEVQASESELMVRSMHLQPFQDDFGTDMIE